MDSPIRDLLLLKLEDIIADEDKIVTLTSASEIFNISVQDVKTLLDTCVTDNRQLKTADIAVTYVISGVLANGKLGVILAQECELAEKRALFKNISNETIYSIQKSKDIDLNAIGLVDGFGSSTVREKPLLGSVISRNCIKRVLKVAKDLPAPPQPKIIVKEKPSFFTKAASSDNVIAKPSNNIKGNNQSKALPKTKSNEGIASFFSKATSKSQQENKPRSKPQEERNGSSTVKDEFVTKEDSEECVKNGTVTPESSASKEDIIENNISTESKQDKRRTVKTPKNKSDKNKRQRSTGKKSEQPTKKRRRIKENDSDSDDIFGDDKQAEEVKSADDSEESIPWIKSLPEATLPPKNKRRKLIDKTYEDEEGFIITSKEWVYESMSEDEKEQKDPKNETNVELKPSAKPEEKTAKPADKREVSPLKAETNKGKKGKKNAVSANQPTLMSFFKKS